MHEAGEEGMVWSVGARAVDPDRQQRLETMLAVRVAAA
jgi:hypothetical protein